MATIDETLAAQNAALDTVTAQLADLAADVAVLVSGELSTEQQALADQIAAKLQAVTDGLTALDTSVGDRDGSAGLPPTLAELCADPGDRFDLAADADAARPGR